MRILLVEDDAVLGDGIKTGLSLSGYTVDWLTDGLSVETALRSETFDLLILDLNLPGKSGLDVLKCIRAEHVSIPVLILTARDTSEDIVVGLDTGADDYVVKPFDLDELTARVRALLRRKGNPINTEIHCRGLIVNPATHTVVYKNKSIDLSRREFAILYSLVDSLDLVISSRQLEEKLYGWGESVESNTIQVHIHHLRKKIDADLITTIRGVGYVIKKP